MTAKSILFGFFSSLLFFSLTPVGWAATLAVPSAYPNIRSALAEASDGDVIEVAKGTYVGDLIVGGTSASGDRIILRSNTGARIKGGITVLNAVVEVDGFYIRPAKSSGGDDGISLGGAHGSVIRNCHIHGFQGTGIVIHASDQVLVEKNAICGNGNGVVCTESQGTLIRYNSISHNDQHGVLNTTTGQEYVVDASFNWWGGSTDVAGDNVLFDNEAEITEPPIVEIARAYVINLPDGNTAYKGDFVDFVVEFMVSGGSEYQQYIARVVALPDYGLRCDDKKKQVVSKVVVGPGPHVMTLTKKVPFCADDITYGISFAGVPYVMDGNWVDLTYRVQLLDPCGDKLAGDTWKEQAVFLVKKPY